MLRASIVMILKLSFATELRLECLKLVDAQDWDEVMEMLVGTREILAKESGGHRDARALDTTSVQSVAALYACS